MKKIGLICATLLVGMSLSACNNLASQQHKASSSSTTKVVKYRHKDHHKKATRKASSKSESSSSSTSSCIQSTSQSSSSQQESTATSSSQNDDSWSEVDKALDQPYKGYPTYRAYCEAHGGDPEVQKQTDEMQTQWEIQNGYANPDGTPTAKGQQVIDDYNNGAYGGAN